MSGTVYNKVYNDFLANNTKNDNINNTKEPWKNAGAQKSAQFLQENYEAPGPIAYPNIAPKYSEGAKKIDEISKSPGISYTPPTVAPGSIAYPNIAPKYSEGAKKIDEISKNLGISYTPPTVSKTEKLNGATGGVVPGENEKTGTGTGTGGYSIEDVLKMIADILKGGEGEGSSDDTEDGGVPVGIPTEPTVSYEDFLKQNGIDIEGDKEREMLRAAQKYDRSRATYGMKAEQLAQAGLTNSGYGEYADAMAYAAYIGNLSQAERDKIYKELQAAAQYQNYLTQKRAEDRAIAQQNFENNQAVKAAERANAQQNFQNKLTLLSSDLSPEVVGSLAAALGMSEKEVEEFVNVYNTASTPETSETDVYPIYSQLIGEGYSDADAKMILAANGYDAKAVTSASNAYYANNGAGGTVATEKVVEAVKNADLSGNAVDAIPTLISQSVAVDMQTGLSDTGKSESKGAVSAALKDLFIKSIDDVDTLLTYAASAIASEFGGKKDETGVKGWNEAEDSTKTRFFAGLVEEAYKTNALTDEDYKAIYEQVVSKDLEEVTNITDFSELAVKAYDDRLCPSNKKLSNEVGEKTINLLKEFIVSVKVEAEEHKPGSGRQEYTPSPKVVIKFKNGKESREPVGYSTKKGYYVFYNLTSEQNDALNSILIQLKSQNK